MRAFTYYNPKDLADAARTLGRSGSMLIAGGTDLLGEMKNRYVRPERLVNLKAVTGLDRIASGGSGLKIGALVKLADIAAHAGIQKSHPGLAEAAASVGSPQLRNVGTLGGNLCQRPRCWYYRGEEYPCIRKGGGVCYAVSGRNKYHCVINGGPCFIVHPSDAAVMLMALGASVTIQGSGGQRELKLDDFFILPEVDSMFENVLKPGEIITEVKVPAQAKNAKSEYVKFKERGSRDFALASAGVLLELDGTTCRKASIVLGGVAPAPYRAVAAEQAIAGKTISQESVQAAAEADLTEARPMTENAYKVGLARAVIKKAVLRAVGMEM
ncbi:MAG TPA: xanthine dehydrogenase family protein subunit M [Candidatus Glassbacteria bacterium]|nr:xanthine dehydrogenase family protein subunit M [Candidatus Glassbacteria bacterium]